MPGFSLQLSDVILMVASMMQHIEDEHVHRFKYKKYVINSTALMVWLKQGLPLIEHMEISLNN